MSPEDQLTCLCRAKGWQWSVDKDDHVEIKSTKEDIWYSNLTQFVHTGYFVSYEKAIELLCNPNPPQP